VTRVGVHFGEAIVGNFGGEGRIQYTALGDSMNTAARLEAANKQLKTRMLVSAEAAERGNVNWLRPMGRIVLRGRATPVEVFEPVPEMPEEERAALATETKGAMRGDTEARARLSKMSDMHPADAALRNLLHRINNTTDGGYFALD
jgi:adenylate cyclase